MVARCLLEDVQKVEKDWPLKLKLNFFSRAQRLLKAAEFKTVFNQSKKYRTPYFLINVHFNKNEFARLGLAVSKKSVKGAVQRNQIKRVVRETFRLNQDLLKGCDIVFVSLNRINELDKLALKEALEEQWKKISKRF